MQLSDACINKINVSTMSREVNPLSFIMTINI